MFTRGVPVAVFSIALVIDGEPILGVIYDPFTDRLYEAVKGGGAFCNNQPIHVNQDALNTKTSGIDFGYSPTMPFNLTRAIYELNQTNRVFAIGSFAHGGLLVAYGATVASVTSGSRPYDVAAVKVIVEEAGGKVTDIYGNEQRYDTDINGTIISNGVVHDEIVKIIRETQGS
jgi:fructose-1,6-bisphosphatase/inositol monophosphatase family enzyme